MNAQRTWGISWRVTKYFTRRLTRARPPHLPDAWFRVRGIDRRIEWRGEVLGAPQSRKIVSAATKGQSPSQRGTSVGGYSPHAHEPPDVSSYLHYMVDSIRSCGKQHPSEMRASWYPHVPGSSVRSPPWGIEVLGLISRGLRNKEIAERLFVRSGPSSSTSAPSSPSSAPTTAPRRSGSPPAAASWNRRKPNLVPRDRARKHPNEQNLYQGTGPKPVLRTITLA
jgi:hypothetical protein